MVKELPILRQVDTGPGGTYLRMEEVGYCLYFEETVTCRLPYQDEQEPLDIGLMSIVDQIADRTWPEWRSHLREPGFGWEYDSRV